MYDVIIIGAGPAGLTAAAYSARSMLKTLVIERYPLTGGQMLLTDVIANFPAYVPSYGSEIAKNLKAQAEEAGAEFITAEVTRIADGKPKAVLAGGKEYQAKTLIIACGAEHKKLGVQGEDKFAGRGVSYCAVCDGGFSEKRILQLSAEGIRLSRTHCIFLPYAERCILSTAGTVSEAVRTSSANANRRTILKLSAVLYAVRYAVKAVLRALSSSRTVSAAGQSAAEFLRLWAWRPRPNL